MTKQRKARNGETFNEVMKALFYEIFQFVGPLTEKLGREEIAKWDSLQHVSLVSRLEETFNVRFSMDEMLEMRTVGDIRKVLRRYGAA